MRYIASNMMRTLMLPATVAHWPLDLLWAPNSRHLVAKVGDAWEHEPDWANEEEPDFAVSLIFVDVPLGNCSVVESPTQQALLAARFPPRCSSWSSAGWLLALHHDADERITLSVYDTSARLVASALVSSLLQSTWLDEAVGAASAHGLELSWSPCGLVAAVLLCRTWLCIWQPGTSSVLQCLDLEHLELASAELVWAPCSSQLLVHCYLVCVLSGQVTRQSELAAGGHISWGVSGLLRFGSTLESGPELLGYQSMHWHSVCGGELQPPHFNISLASTSRLAGFLGSRAGCERVLHVDSAVSPDGAHIAAITWHVLPAALGYCSRLASPRLEVICLSTGLRVHFPISKCVWPQHRSWRREPWYLKPWSWAVESLLPEWPLEFDIRFSADGTQLVCTSEWGSRHLLVSFA